ncbi:MAG TPA: trypsin-like serine protease [Bacteroidetes bacterium]|nr:trypsin-like serine protease [Bacteroidota bacterium]
MRLKCFVPFCILIIFGVKSGHAGINYSGCGQNFLNAGHVIGPSGNTGFWPWMVSIGYNHNSKWNHQCGGTIITDQHILTAGHCLTNHIGKWSVRIGDRTLNKDIGDWPVTEELIQTAYLHPKYMKHLKT